LLIKAFALSNCQKSFRPPFSKGGAVKVAETLSPSAEGEIFLSALLFCKLFSCAYIAKRKAADKLSLFDVLLFSKQWFSVVRPLLLHFSPPVFSFSPFSSKEIYVTTKKEELSIFLK